MTEPIKRDLDTILELKENHDRLVLELQQAKEENPAPVEEIGNWWPFWIGGIIGVFIGYFVP